MAAFWPGSDDRGVALRGQCPMITSLGKVCWRATAGRAPGGLPPPARRADPPGRRTGLQWTKHRRFGPLCHVPQRGLSVQPTYSYALRFVAMLSGLQCVMDRVNGVQFIRERDPRWLRTPPRGLRRKCGVFALCPYRDRPALETSVADGRDFFKLAGTPA